VHKPPLASRFSHLALLILALYASLTCTTSASAVAVDAVSVFVVSTAALITSLTLFVCVRGGYVCA